MSLAPFQPDPTFADEQALARYLANLPWVTQCAIKAGRITVQQIEAAFLMGQPITPSAPLTGEDRDYELIGTIPSHEWGD